MNHPPFIKRYCDPRRARAAAAHHNWLASLASARTPALLATTTHELVFEHLGDRRPGPEHLDILAEALGRTHAEAYTKDLHRARLAQPFTTTDGLIITDFVSPRSEVLDRIAVPLKDSPVAFYKDANIRNFLLTDDGVAIVDFDDLTLAPFGYDLAKLVLSTAMTFGPLAAEAIEHALAVYNTSTAQVRTDTTCAMNQLRLYLEVHHDLTARYLHSHGYQHPWPDLRPWPKPS